MASLRADSTNDPSCDSVARQSFSFDTGWAKVRTTSFSGRKLLQTHPRSRVAPLCTWMLGGSARNRNEDKTVSQYGGPRNGGKKDADPSGTGLFCNLIMGVVVGVKSSELHVKEVPLRAALLPGRNELGHGGELLEQLALAFGSQGSSST